MPIANPEQLSFVGGLNAQAAPDKIGDIGFFAQPGNNAKNVGLTVWTPSGTYAPANTKHRVPPVPIEPGPAKREGATG